ncbi:MAG TPA: helix-turn-helix transcriptional regulator [Candidatus Merdivicinus faecavium]|nr:helix-turn-helix transcriptional regulator [Candidatus Merdivicinus faecavium]
MLIDYGCSPVNADWQVNEKTACGFVRVYDIYEGEVFCREGVSEPGEEILLRPGSICLFPSAAPYFLRQNPQNRLFCTHLHLDIAPALLRRTLTLEAPQGSIVRGIFDALRAAVCGGEGRVVRLLSDAFEQYCVGRELFAMPEGEIARALAAMAAEFRKNWSVAELSALAGYSEPYFIRRFRAETGVSPHQYLIGRRMKEALRLLWSGLPVSEVARRCGYAELKAFSRSFRRWYGLSPSQYRESGRLYP